MPFYQEAAEQTSALYLAQKAFPNLTFNHPVGLFSDPTGANRLFVIEQSGVIKVFSNTQNVSGSAVFLDITDRVLYGGEQGLLGVAFDPNYTQSHNFYVDYVADNPRRSVIARYTADQNNPDLAYPNSQQVILEISQPYSNHKGGELAFGPDGYLYIGVGDGGSEGDPNGNGQNRSILLGKILRIDVNSQSNGRNYGIPADNPFVGNTDGFLEEIYAYGLRNPWRFSFDPATGQLWVGDVGQDRLEEIDLVEKGKNYGWNTMEGTLCYNPPSGCNGTGLTLPIWNYTHDLGNAIIGGYVYHGKALPALDGAYVYGDYGSGRIWALRYSGTAANTLMVDSGQSITSFGLDQNQELYFTSSNGNIYTLSAPAVPEFPLPIQTGLALMLVLFAVLMVLARLTKEPFRKINR